MFKLVPLRMLESELTSASAATIAGFADLPMVELLVNRAPIFREVGLADEWVVAFPV